MFLDKQAALPVTGLSGAAELSIGVRLHPRSLAKVKVLGFRANGINTVLALTGELDLIGNYAGVTGSAGFSLGADGRGGNYAGVGMFARIPLGHFALRLDAVANTVSRTDFLGYGLQTTAGFEVTWDR